jgi:hypothetical protein
MATNIALILSSLGIGGLLGGFIQSFLNKQQYKFSKIFEFKEARYKAIAILLWVAMNPNDYELKQLARHRPDIENTEGLNYELKMEYHNAMLFASDEVLSSLDMFLNHKNTENWKLVARAMRKDLYT